LRRLLLLSALAGAAAFAGAADSAAPARKAAPVRRAAPVQRDWTRTVVATPEGGFRMGNPAARVKLVEYGSLTCSHCAAFAAEGVEPLMAYVRRGRVSYEYRNYVLNGIDVVATMLARCSGPAHFFAMAHDLYATQPTWVGRINGLSDERRAELNAMPEAQRRRRLGELGGLTQLAGRHGLTAARAGQCFADPAGLDRLDRMVEAAGALGVTGTPTFFLNGRMVQTNLWAGIEPLLRQAGG
jgi:protein-disulfide isomerase